MTIWMDDYQAIPPPRPMTLQEKSNLVAMLWAAGTDMPTTSQYVLLPLPLVLKLYTICDESSCKIPLNLERFK